MLDLHTAEVFDHCVIVYCRRNKAKQRIVLQLLDRFCRLCNSIGVASFEWVRILLKLEMLSQPQRNDLLPLEINGLNSAETASVEMPQSVLVLVGLII